MNCKPGDLAVVIKSLKGESIGKICQVISPLDHGNWIVEFSSPIGWGGSSIPTHRCGRCPDAWLRPLRDPGDDAKDEMLRPLPKEVTA